MTTGMLGMCLQSKCKAALEAKDKSIADLRSEVNDKERRTQVKVQNIEAKFTTALDEKSMIVLKLEEECLK